MRYPVTSCLLVILAVLAMGGCFTSECHEQPTLPECQLGFIVAKHTYTRGLDSAIQIKFPGLDELWLPNTPLEASIVQGDTIPLTSVKFAERDYSCTPPTTNAQFKGLRLGPWTVTLKQADREAAPQSIRLQEPLAYAQATQFQSLTVLRTELAFVESLGISNGVIYGLASGTIGFVNYRAVRRYSYQDSKGVTPRPLPVTADLLDPQMFGTALLATAGMGVYVSEKPGDATAKHLKCKAQWTDLTPADCPPLGFTVPDLTRAMVVTPDGARMILADDKVGLKWGTLASKTAPATTIMTTAALTGTITTRLAVTDLDGDQRADLIAVWNNATAQTVRVFLGTTSEFTESPELSARLSDAIGVTPITALAADDINSDGFGDVVIARGQALTVLQNQSDRFEPAWNTTVMPTASTTISAIALGKLDGWAAGKPLDIVTASNTGYDMSMSPPKNTMYLSVFRAQ